jgi:hypothetical protein
MYNRVAVLTTALALTVATAASAQTTVEVSGKVVRVDPGTQIVILDNNQAFRVGPNTVLMVDNRPVSLGTLQPGQAVVIRSGEALAVTSSAPGAAAPGGTVVVTAPPAPSSPRQTLYGQITDVSTGEIKIKTDKDSFEVKVPRELAAQLRKGDVVRLDLTFQPR